MASEIVAAHGDGVVVPVTVAVPESVDGMVDSLSKLGGLLTAVEWARAAIVTAYVEPIEGNQQVRTSAHLSIRAFAALGIAGLKSDNTVRRYVNAWMTEVGTRPQPGDNVTLPTTPFPTSTPNGGKKDGHDLEDRLKQDRRRILDALGKAHTVNTEWVLDWLAKNGPGHVPTVAGDDTQDFALALWEHVIQPVYGSWDVFKGDLNAAVNTQRHQQEQMYRQMGKS